MPQHPQIGQGQKLTLLQRADTINRKESARIEKQLPAAVANFSPPKPDGFDEISLPGETVRPMVEDIRWNQRFDNYLRAFETLRRAVDLAHQRDLSELEQQGLIKGFGFTHELAWNVLKDHLEETGISGIIGSKGATREAFKKGLIVDGESWMEMIKSRNLSSHTYNPDTAEEVVSNILSRFYPAFEQMAATFSALAEQSEDN